MEREELELPIDEALDALAHPQRRILLVRLLEHNPQSDNPVVVADSEQTADAVEQLVTMNHVHLPKLEQYGFIEWDQEANEVKKGPNFEEIRPLLELLADNEDALPEGWL